ncbi:unnamed protein product [Angiostrongylus costaricensis]|uniref:RALGAPB_N domain-containing protein n=1 Tax=Angiostrongylus costaricensis TaxID=334426 RepID=A0A0R3PT89_ANGCS|nr:unnamed protein product [Angiostrongylus costaricensis]
MRVGSRVVDILFDLWFHAVLNEEIPSPTYWRTLSALCRRWRHHVSFENFCLEKFQEGGIIFTNRM